MHRVRRTLDTKSLTLNTTNTLELPRDYLIQQILLNFKLNMDTGASAPTYIEDAPHTIVKRMRLYVTGKRNEILYDVMPKAFVSLQEIDYRVTPYSDSLPGASQTGVDVNFVWKVDFRIDKSDMYDVMSSLDSYRYSSVRLEFEVGTASDLASANQPTINSFDVTPTLIEFIPDDFEFEPITKYVYVREVDIANSIDLETGKVLRRLGLLVKDASGNRSNTIVSKYEILKGANPIVPVVSFSHSRFMDRIEYQGTNPAGFTMVDFANVNAIEGSQNLENAKEGDVKLKLTYSGSGKLELLYDWVKL